MTPAEVVELYKKFSGPTQHTFEMLNDEDKKNFSNELTELWEKHNIAKDGTTIVDAEYLEVTAVKR
jgi:hypothetical protein